MRHLIAPILGIATLAAGCATAPFGYDPSKLSADQINAMVKDKSATVSCGLLTGTYGRGVAVYVNFDEASRQTTGTVTVDSECKTTVNLVGSSAASAPRGSTP